MKTIKSDKWHVAGAPPSLRSFGAASKWRVTCLRSAASARQAGGGKNVTARNKVRDSLPRLLLTRGFTLIELLVVITIIGILASFTVPVLSVVKRHQYISQTQAEMGQLQAAIESYHATYGFYPPSNPGYPSNTNDAMFSPLFFELLGTTNNNGTYQTLDGSASIRVSALTAPTTPLGVGGFVNCSKPGSGEDSRAAKNFLPSLNSNRYGLNITNSAADPINPVVLLLGSVGGPDSTYKPLGASGLNPWRYVSPGVNNPNSYDLWIQLEIGGKANLVCNWSKEVQINNPLP